jgi:hypothetical protein
MGTNKEVSMESLPIGTNKEVSMESLPLKKGDLEGFIAVAYHF